MFNTSDYRRRLFRATAAIAGCLGIAACAVAQSYPNKPILIIASTAPGGPVDITARTVAPEFSKAVCSVRETRSYSVLLIPATVP